MRKPFLAFLLQLPAAKAMPVAGVARCQMSSEKAAPLPFFLSCKGPSGVMQQGQSSRPVSPPDAAGVKAGAPLGMSFPCSPRVAGREPRQDAAVALCSISLMCCDSPAELLTHGAICGEMKPGDTKQEACPRCPWPRAGLCGVLWVA